MLLRNLIISLLTLAIAIPSKGDTESTDSVSPLRPVFAAYTFEAGSGHLADTYLTPLKYSGWHMGLDYTRYQAMGFDPDNWTMSLQGKLSVDKTDNPARNATMWDLMLSLDWGMMRKFRPLPGLTLAGGGSKSREPGPSISRDMPPISGR